MRTKSLRIASAVLLVAAFAAVLLSVLHYFDRKSGQLDSEYEDTQNRVSNYQKPEDYGTVKLKNKTYDITAPVKTYLLIGTDDSGNEAGEGEEYHGAMADVLILIVVNEDEQSYGLLQLNRETMTEVPLMNTEGNAYASAMLPLCGAHWYGGNPKQSCENTVNTVSTMLGGLPIDGYYALQMEAIPVMNRVMGGVTVTFEEDLTELDLAMQKGATLTLTDAQAQKLIRARSELEDDRNSERMSRQRIFLSGFMNQLKAEQAENSDFVIRLYDALNPYSTQDINMNELVKLVNRTANFTNKGTFVIEGESRLEDTFGDGEERWRFYMDKNSMVKIIKELYPLAEQDAKKEEE